MGFEKKTIASVIVTYNRISDLKLALSALAAQTLQSNSIYIVDNGSTDGTREFLQGIDLAGQSEIVCIFSEENMGGAGGFNAGLKRAHERGYDYYWLMDDDGRPVSENALELLVAHAEQSVGSDGLAIVNAMVTADGETLSFAAQSGNQSVKSFVSSSVNGVVENEIAPFNGSLLSNGLVRAIGYPDKSFFIRGDEVDYGMRARKAGAYFATVCDAVFHHPYFDNETRLVLGKRIRAHTDSPWKEYYIVRNSTFMTLRNSGRTRSLYRLFGRLLEALLGSENKLRTMTAMLKGYSDGVHGRMGRRVEPGQL